MSSSNPNTRHVFSHEVQADKIVLRPIKYTNPTQKITEKKEMSHHIPVHLDLSRLLTQAELDTIGYLDLTGMSGMPCYTCNDIGTMVFRQVYVGPEHIQQCGLMEEFGRLRQILLHPNYEPALSATNPRKNVHKHQPVITRQPTNGPSSIQMSAIARQNVANNGQITNRLFELAGKLLETFVPSVGEVSRDNEWHRNASLTFGGKRFSNAIQFNFTPLNITLQGSLGNRGQLHTDAHDDELMFSVVLFFGNFPDEVFPGYFNNTTFRTRFVAAPFSAYIFPAKACFHGGSGGGRYPPSVPLGHPLRYVTPPGVVLPRLEGPAAQNYTRCVVIVYPTEPAFHPTPCSINTELVIPAGLKLFNSLKEQQEWKMRLYIVHEPTFVAIMSLTEEELFHKAIPRVWLWLRPWWRLLRLASKTFFNGMDMDGEDRQRYAEVDAKEVNRPDGGRGMANNPTEVAEELALRVRLEDLTAWYEPHRTTRAEQFVSKFWWLDMKTLTTERPSLEMAKKTMEEHRRGERADITQLRSDIRETFFGTAYKKSVPFAERVVNTHADYNHVFDPATDTIPARPDWVPSEDGGVEVENEEAEDSVMDESEALDDEDDVMTEMEAEDEDEDEDVDF